MAEPAQPVAWHAMAAAEVVARLGSDAAHGLSAEAVALRSAHHGPNTLPEARKRSAVRVFLRQFKSPLIYILFIAAALAAGMGHVGDSGVILGVVIVNALIGAYQEGRAEAFHGGAAPARGAAGARGSRGPGASDSCARFGAGRHRASQPPATRSAPTRGCSTPPRSPPPKPRSPASRCRWRRSCLRCPRPPHWRTGATWCSRAPPSRPAGRAL